VTSPDVPSRDEVQAGVDGNGARGAPALLDVQDLRKFFPVRGGVLRRSVDQVRAVDGVSFRLHRGETLGLVGESGCGKSTTGRAVLRLIEPTSGRVIYDGADLAELDRAQFRSFRRRAQIVFQDPFGSLNPRMTVGGMLEEILKVHRLGETRADWSTRVRELLEMVGLHSEHAGRYPHEFSGGQRQRIGIARALAVEPEFIVCDEPVSALDVSVQAQVINLLRDLQEDLGLTYLFVAHDLGVVEYMSDRVAVMYLGKIVETAAARDLYDAPKHPYTRALLSAAPSHDPRVRSNRQRIRLSGDVPSPIRPPSGCAFYPRCPHPGKDEECRKVAPVLEEKAPNHVAACFKNPMPVDWA
jgi:oligopeptide/dipeptide ABC transporter ATP-binding protein